MPESSPDERKSPLIALLALAVVLIVGAVVAFALFAKPAPAPMPEPKIAAAASTPPMRTEPPASPRVDRPAPTPDASPSPTPDAAAPAWEGRIESILSANTNEAQTAQALLNLLPTLPPEGQAEAANHITNLLPDANYAQAKPVLLNPNTPEPVLSVFFTDLMNRDDATKLRAFLDIAKVPNHPFHEEALSDLQIYLGEDLGTDWTKWNAAVEQYLKAAAADQQ